MKYMQFYINKGPEFWKALYLTLSIEQDKCPKYNGSSILLCPIHYCVPKVISKNASD